MSPQERDRILNELAAANGLLDLLKQARTEGVAVVAIIWPRTCEGHRLATRLQYAGIPVVDGIGERPVLVTQAGVRRICREAEVAAE